MGCLDSRVNLPTANEYEEAVVKLLQWVQAVVKQPFAKERHAHLMSALDVLNATAASDISAACTVDEGPELVVARMAAQVAYLASLLEYGQFLCKTGTTDDAHGGGVTLQGPCSD